MKQSSEILVFVCAALLVSCGEADPSPTGPQPAQLTLSVAPLAFADVTDVAYTIEVRNKSGQTVWRQERLSAAKYGNGRGLTFVGPCDASEGENPNTVLLVLEDLYGPAGAIDRDTYRNPTRPTPLSASFTCRENADTLVELSLTVLRDARQGFFDVAVQLDDLFCSAKMDCGEPGDRNVLLHGVGSAERTPTAVFAIACTGGLGADTYLWLDPIVVTCGTTSYTLDPTAGPGNHYSTSDPPPAPLSQVATTHGVEALSQGGTSYNKLYFTMAIGLDTEAITSDCSFTAAATASDGPFAVPYTTPARTAYPVMRWQIDLVDALSDDFACGEHALDDPNALEGTGVFTDYTGFDAPEVFDHRVRRDPAAPTGSVVEARGGAADGFVAVRVVDDLTGDGVDAGDVGLAGVTIEVASVSGGATATYLTGPGGVVTLTLSPGDWVVSVPEQAALGAFRDSSTPTSASVTVTAGATASAAFGFVRAGRLEGLVYGDANASGAREPGEGGVPGVRVAVFDGATELGWALTGADGSFTIEGLAAGTWPFVVDAESVRDAGWVRAFGVPPSVSVLAGQTTDAGVIGLEPPATLTGVVYLDQDGDGAQGAGEGGLAGVLVELRTSAGLAVGTTSTGGDGRYAFVVDGGSAWELAVDPGQVALATYDGLTTPSPVVVATLAAGATGGADFGVAGEVVTLSGRIRGTVFADADGSGSLEPGELGVPGVEVTATLSGTTVTTTTDSLGRFTFDVPAGTWSVTIDLQQSALSDYTAASTTLPRGVVVSAGADAQVDLGVLEPVEIVGHVFVDEEADRVFDGGEQVVVGVVVELVEQGTGALYSQTTDAGGAFALLVAPGTWKVRLGADQAVMSGYRGPFFLGGIDTFVLAPGDHLEVDAAVEVGP